MESNFRNQRKTKLETASENVFSVEASHQKSEMARLEREMTRLQRSIELSATAKALTGLEI